MSKTINANVRKRAGKGAAREIRRGGRCPAVVYGNKQPPLKVIVEPKQIIKHLQNGAFYNTVYDLDLDGKVEKVLPRDIQFHVVKDTVEHVDFMRVDEKLVVKVSIPVEYVGIEDNEASRMGGRLQIVRRDIELMALAGKIPAKFTVDVSQTKFGQILRISDLHLEEGLSPVITDRDFVLASMKAPRGSLSEEDEDLDADSDGEGEEESTESTDEKESN